MSSTFSSKRKRFSSTITIENHDRLKAISDRTRIPMSQLHEIGIEMVIKQFEEDNTNGKQY